MCFGTRRREAVQWRTRLDSCPDIADLVLALDDRRNSLGDILQENDWYQASVGLLSPGAGRLDGVRDSRHVRLHTLEVFVVLSSRSSASRPSSVMARSFFTSVVFRLMLLSRCLRESSSAWRECYSARPTRRSFGLAVWKERSSAARTWPLRVQICLAQLRSLSLAGELLLSRSVLRRCVMDKLCMSALLMDTKEQQVQLSSAVLTASLLLVPLSSSADGASFTNCLFSASPTFRPPPPPAAFSIDSGGQLCGPCGKGALSSGVWTPETYTQHKHHHHQQDRTTLKDLTDARQVSSCAKHETLCPSSYYPAALLSSVASPPPLLLQQEEERIVSGRPSALAGATSCSACSSSSVLCVPTAALLRLV